MSARSRIRKAAKQRWGLAPVADPQPAVASCVCAEQSEYVEYQNQIIVASVNLMNTLSMMSSKGPVFNVHEDADPRDTLVLRNALVNLQFILEGAPLPAFALPSVQELNS